jgi:hypothetical protein
MPTAPEDAVGRTGTKRPCKGAAHKGGGRGGGEHTTGHVRNAHQASAGKRDKQAQIHHTSPSLAPTTQTPNRPPRAKKKPREIVFQRWTPNKRQCAPQALWCSSCEARGIRSRFEQAERQHAPQQATEGKATTTHSWMCGLEPTIRISTTTWPNNPKRATPPPTNEGGEKPRQPPQQAAESNATANTNPNKPQQVRKVGGGAVLAQGHQLRDHVEGHVLHGRQDGGVHRVLLVNCTSRTGMYHGFVCAKAGAGRTGLL